MNRLAAAGLLLAAIIHLIPGVGMLGAERLETLYGLSMTDPNLLILMRHRALLFALLGLLLAAAAFVPAWRGLALAAGYASVLGFFAFAYAVPGHSGEIARIVRGDWIALGGLVVASIAHAANARRRPAR